MTKSATDNMRKLKKILPRSADFYGPLPKRPSEAKGFLPEKKLKPASFVAPKRYLSNLSQIL